MKKIILCTMLLITTCLSACSGDSETVSEDNQPVENNIDVEDNKNASGNNTEDYSQSENNEDYKSGGISATSYESEWMGINFNFPPGYIVNWDLINASHELTEIQKSKYSEYQYLELSICKKNDENVHFDIYVDFPKTNKTDQQAAEDIKNDIISAYENAEAQSNGSITIDSTWQEPVEYQIAGDIYIMYESETNTFMNSSPYNKSHSWFLCKVNNGYRVSFQFYGFENWADVEAILSNITSV